MIRLQQGGSATFRLVDIAVANKKTRVPMPASRRAKQFMPFDALRGLKEAIADKEKITNPKTELAEDMVREINSILVDLRKGQNVTVVYYNDYEEEYHQLTGAVEKVDAYWKLLQIGNIAIDFDEISEIHTDFESFLPHIYE